MASIARPHPDPPDTPRQNHLLAALPPEEYERLLPHLEPLELLPGRTVHYAGAHETELSFLTSGIVSRFCVTRSGASAEFAVTGCEGVIGLAAFLGGASTPSQAVVMSAGHAYRLSADLVRNECERGRALSHLLRRYTHALMVQAGQIAACNRHHSVPQQLCRWILSCLDRLPSNQLTVTQEAIAHMLGVRRQGVAEATRKLQRAGLIDGRRGHITVLDRFGMETRVCECYAVVKREYECLLPEPGGARSRVRQIDMHQIEAIA